MKVFLVTWFVFTDGDTLEVSLIAPSLLKVTWIWKNEIYRIVWCYKASIHVNDLANPLLFLINSFGKIHSHNQSTIHYLIGSRSISIALPAIQLHSSSLLRQTWLRKLPNHVRLTTESYLYYQNHIPGISEAKPVWHGPTQNPPRGYTHSYDGV